MKCRSRLSIPVAGLILVFWVGACNSGTETTTKEPAGFVRVHYVTQTSGEVGDFETDVVTDGAHLVRQTVVAGEGRVGSYVITDGTHELSYATDRIPAFERWALADRPDEVLVVALLADGKEFAVACPAARTVGTEEMLTRRVVHYACGGATAQELWVDDATRIVLRDKWASGEYDSVATKIEFDVTVPADYLSTALSAEMQTYGSLPTFTIPALDGGELSSATFGGKPFIVVVGDPAGLRTTIGRLLPLTANGTKPPLVGLLVATIPNDWKGSLLNPEDAKKLAGVVAKSAGDFPVPVGIDFKGAVGYEIERAVGAEDGETRVGVAFVRRDGTIAEIVGGDASDAQLAGQVKALDSASEDWPHG